MFITVDSIKRICFLVISISMGIFPLLIKFFS